MTTIMTPHYVTDATARCWGREWADELDELDELGARLMTETEVLARLDAAAASSGLEVTGWAQEACTESYLRGATEFWRRMSPMPPARRCWSCKARDGHAHGCAAAEMARIRASMEVAS